MFCSLYENSLLFCYYFFFFFNDTATTEIYTLSLHDALPISPPRSRIGGPPAEGPRHPAGPGVLAAQRSPDRHWRHPAPRPGLDRASSRLLHADVGVGDQPRRAGAPQRPAVTYQLLKLIHLVAVIIFLGNIITGLFWKAHADRTRDLRFIAHTMHGIVRADRWFTIPGVVAITLAGIFTAIQSGLPILGTGCPVVARRLHN